MRLSLADQERLGSTVKQTDLKITLREHFLYPNQKISNRSALVRNLSDCSFWRSAQGPKNAKRPGPCALLQNGT